jgi:hypothetical protein
VAAVSGESRWKRDVDKISWKQAVPDP